mmetsp:Transcript_1533/g.1652  ORF Transcript_1533/g.1652 Transcript_1533/m.1652 type:complete len:110 (-) Transcript_1533:57-386(-)
MKKLQFYMRLVRGMMMMFEGEVDIGEEYEGEIESSSKGEITWEEQHIEQDMEWSTGNEDNDEDAYDDEDGEERDDDDEDDLDGWEMSGLNMHGRHKKEEEEEDHEAGGD